MFARLVLALSHRSKCSQRLKKIQKNFTLKNFLVLPILVSYTCIYLYNLTNNTPNTSLIIVRYQSFHNLKNGTDELVRTIAIFVCDHCWGQLRKLLYYLIPYSFVTHVNDLIFLLTKSFEILVVNIFASLFFAFEKK